MRKTIWVVLIPLLVSALTGCGNPPTDQSPSQQGSGPRPASEPAAETDPPGGESVKVEQACSGGTVPPAIAGAYRDSFGHTQIIGDGRWAMQLKEELEGSALVEGLTHSSHTICSVDNENGVIVAENATNRYHPGKFSQFNWILVDDRLWFCQIEADAESREAAAAHPRADPSNPAEGGCGGFPWSALELT